MPAHPRTAPHSHRQRSSLATPLGLRLAVVPRVGQRVWSQYGKDRDELWWPGLIVQVHHKAVDVQYDDGDIESRKSLSRIVPVQIDPA